MPEPGTINPQSRQLIHKKKQFSTWIPASSPARLDTKTAKQLQTRLSATKASEIEKAPLRPEILPRKSETQSFPDH
jgi:hypothetical protein